MLYKILFTGYMIVGTYKTWKRIPALFEFTKDTDDPYLKNPLIIFLGSFVSVLTWPLMLFAPKY